MTFWLPPLVEEPGWNPALHPRDTLGKFAAKIGAAFHAPHAVVPEYDARQLKFGKSAGGSNGARWAFTPEGERWLVKTYKGNEDRVATELLANAVYREMGARVPRAGRIRLHNGRQALAYPTIEGKPQPHVFQRRGAQPSAEVGKHFMTDALLANWDVAGLEDDNILWDPQGQPFRVDQGGTFEFRAMGKLKDFGPIPVEVTSMLMPGGQGRRSSAVTMADLKAQARQIAETLTPGKIDKLVAAAGFKNAKMAGRVRRNLRLRVHWMGEFAAGRVGMPELPGKAQESDAFWLEEALGYLTGAWNPHLHPRDAYGKFIDSIDQIGSSFKGIKLDSKTTVTKDKDGTYRVVRSGGIIKGFKDSSDAARAALDRSLKGKESDSVGGGVSYKHFDDFLSKQGVDPNEAGHFGGVEMTPTELVAERNRIQQALATAQSSEDKYVQRQIPTLKLRLANAEVKVKKLTPAQQAGTAGLPDPNAAGATGKVTPADVLPQIKALHALTTKSPAIAVGKGHAVKLGDGSYGVNIAGKTEKYTSSLQAAKALTIGKHQGIPAAVTADIQKVKALNVGELHTLENGASIKALASGNYQIFSPQGWAVSGTWYSPAEAVHDAHAMYGSSKKAEPAKPAPKPAAKPIKGMQENKLGMEHPTYGKMGAKLKDLDLAAGDVIQYKKGGWKYEIVDAQPAGYPEGSVKVKAANGQTKVYSGFKAPAFVQKADGSELKLKSDASSGPQDMPGGIPPSKMGIGMQYELTYASGASAKAEIFAEDSKNWYVKTLGQSDPPLSKAGTISKTEGIAKPPPGLTLSILKPAGGSTQGGGATPSLTADQVAGKLESGAGKWENMSALKDGAVFQTPAGQIGVLKKNENAYTGYLAAYDIKTGAKFEPHATNYAPYKASEDPLVMQAAEKLLKDAQKPAPGGGTSSAAAAATSGDQTHHTATSVHPSWGPGSLKGKAAEDHLHALQPALKPAAKSAMKQYTNGSYDAINTGLRQGTLPEKHAETIMALDQAFHDAPALDVDVITHRGAQLSDFHGELKAGKIVQDLGYMSTSPTKPWAKTVQLHMRLRAGTKNALWVDNFSSHSGEREAVIRRAAVMKVLQVAEVGNKTHVYVDVLG